MEVAKEHTIKNYMYRYIRVFEGLSTAVRACKQQHNAGVSSSSTALLFCLPQSQQGDVHLVLVISMCGIPFALGLLKLS